MSATIRYPVVGVPKYANAAALPATSLNGDVAVTLDTDTLYTSNGSTWTAVGGGGGGVSAVGALDGNTASANGGSISGTSLFFQSASATRPGLLNISAQTLAGVKTLKDGIILTSPAQISGTAGGGGIAGNSVILQGGIGNNDAFSGATITANGGASNGTGGIASLLGGDGTGHEGGNVALQGGIGDTAKDGGTITLVGGSGNAETSNGASAEFGGGSGNGQGGGASISGGNGASHVGGPVSINAGGGDSGFAGGNLTLSGGNGNAGSSVGASGTFYGGIEDGTGGDLGLGAGDAEGGSGSQGGNVFINSGLGDGSGADGEIVIRGHISSSSNGNSPTPAAQAGAGSGASASLSTNASDTSGVLTLATGASGRSSGAQVKVTFQKPYTVAPVVVFSDANASAAVNLVLAAAYVTSSTTAFTINFNTAASGAITFVWNYIVIGTPG